MLNQIHHLDLFALCAALEPGSVELILCDLPYGTTKNGWDKIIAFEPMWSIFKRVLRPNGAVVLTASQPFTSKLVLSNLPWFHEEVIWDKVATTGYPDANRKHLKRHESVLVFCERQPTYNPQKRAGIPYQRGKRSANFSGYGDLRDKVIEKKADRFPTSIVTFSAANGKRERGLHPNQKPLALFRYLIRTYSNYGELVLDPCCGSGTTAIAALEEGRNFICGDSAMEYVEVARRRLAQPRSVSFLTE